MAGGKVMSDKHNFMIIGGDCRFSYIKKVLNEKGFDAVRIYPGEYRADDFDKADIFILPVPVSRDNVNINAPLADETFCFGDFIRLLPENCIVAGGLWCDDQREKLESKGVKVFDYYKDEDLAKKNAVPTAEGDIGILIDTLPVTIDSLKCAVTGYGKCGSVLCKKLKALGADITAAARSEQNLKTAEKDGIQTCPVSDFGKIADRFDVIINTVPARIIDENIISKLKKDCTIIEIASAPFGVDFDCAARYGINTVKAGSLPGKTSPQTAGAIICDTVLKFFGSDNDGD